MQDERPRRNWHGPTGVGLSTPREMEKPVRLDRDAGRTRLYGEAPITPLAKRLVLQCDIDGNAQKSSQARSTAPSTTWKRVAARRSRRTGGSRSRSSTPGRASGQPFEQGGAAAGVEMGGDLVEQQDRRRAAAAGDELGMGKDEAEQQRLLFAGRAEARRVAALRRWVTARSWRCGPAVARPAAASRPRLARSAGGEIAAVPAIERQSRRAGNRRRGSRGHVSPSAATVRARASAKCRAMIGHSGFECGKPVPGRRPRARQATCCARASPLRSATAWWAWPGSSASISRSRKRRRSPALSANRRSIAGVSHSTDSHSDSALTEAAAPLIRTCRRSGAVASVPVPSSVPSVSPRRDREAARPRLLRHFDSGARRKPRPGVSNETASRILVLPAPLGPLSRTKPGDGIEHRVGVIAQVGQGEARQRHHSGLAKRSRCA